MSKATLMLVGGALVAAYAVRAGMRGKLPGGLQSSFSSVQATLSSGVAERVAMAQPKVKSVTASRELYASLGKYRVIDVRELSERMLPMGNVPTSVHIPLAQVLDGSAAIPAKPDDALLMVCRSGARSRRASEALVQRGFTDVTNLEGGTMDWVAQGLPTVPHEASGQAVGEGTSKQ